MLAFYNSINPTNSFYDELIDCLLLFFIVHPSTKISPTLTY